MPQYQGPFTRVDWADQDNKPMCTVFEDDDQAKEFIKGLQLRPDISLAAKACIRFTEHYHLLPNK